jgi:mannosyltransferase
MTRRKQRPAKKSRVAAERERAQAARVAQSRAVRAPTLTVWGFLVLLLVLAVALRALNLTAQSLWADEGNSVRLTERPLRLVIDAARADVHPPGYYLLLWCWVRLFGQGEVAVRALSVVIGTALVGAVYLLGQRVFSARAAWLAAFCAAVSPFQVQYSQEVRMYILVAFLGIGATYALIRWLEAVESGKSRPRRWITLYVAALAAGLWTHYSFPIVIAALNVAWLVWWIRRRGEAAWGELAVWWVGAHLAALVLYLPWLPTAWGRVTGYGPISERYPVPYIVAQALRLLSVGETVRGDDLTRWLTVGMVGLAVFGGWGGFVPAAPSRKRVSGVCTLALLLLVLAPMAMMIGLALAGRPAYRPKFFLVASPPFCLLVGVGISLLESSSGKRTMYNRLWLLLGLAVVSVGAVRSLRGYYFDPAFARSDYRAIAAYVESVEREGDAVLLNAPNQWEVFTYYHHQHVPVYPLCRTRPAIEADVVAELEEIATRHSRLFALYWAVEESDPERIVERWLAANTFKASDTWYGDVRLVVYAVPEALAEIGMDHALTDVRLGDAIALRGYTLAPDDVQRGDILQVTLFWEALAVPHGRQKVFLHLVDTMGQIVSQYDGEPGNGMNPTTGWAPDHGVFRDRYGVSVPLTLPDGEYRLLVGMYDISGAPRLSITLDGQPAGEMLPLAAIDLD